LTDVSSLTWDPLGGVPIRWEHGERTEKYVVGQDPSVGSTTRKMRLNSSRV